MSRQRLIDFNEIRFITVPIAPVLKGEKVHYEGVAFVNQVLEIPAVKAVPIEVLQEIRQEIEKIPTTIKGIGYFNERDVLAYQIDVLKIIDTHISAITRKSISDRDCEHCKHRHPIGCDVWECTFEPRDEDKDEEDNE